MLQCYCTCILYLWVGGVVSDLLSYVMIYVAHIFIEEYNVQCIL